MHLTHDFGGAGSSTNFSAPSWDRLDLKSISPWRRTSKRVSAQGLRSGSSPSVLCGSRHRSGHFSSWTTSCAPGFLCKYVQMHKGVRQVVWRF